MPELRREQLHDFIGAMRDLNRENDFLYKCFFVAVTALCVGAFSLGFGLFYGYIQINV